MANIILKRVHFLKKELKQAFQPRNLIILILGLILMAAGVALSKIADLGTSPIASIPNVLSFIFPYPIGTLTIFFMVFLVCLEPIFLKVKFSYLNLLQLIPGSFFGIFINFFMYLFSDINPTTYFYKLVLTFLSIFILAIGVFFEVSSDSIVLPGEGLAIAASTGLNIPFSKVKIYVDSSMVIAAFIIALLVFHSLTGIREGTILSALLVGKTVSAIKKYLIKSYPHK